MHDDPTKGTAMRPLFKWLGDIFPAVRTLLAASVRVGLYYPSDGAFSLGLQDGKEQTPTSIGNGPSQMMALEHTFDVELLNVDNVETN
jgi:hypothetical protein